MFQWLLCAWRAWCAQLHDLQDDAWKLQVRGVPMYQHPCPLAQDQQPPLNAQLPSPYTQRPATIARYILPQCTKHRDGVHPSATPAIILLQQECQWHLASHASPTQPDAHTPTSRPTCPHPQVFGELEALKRQLATLNSLEAELDLAEAHLDAEEGVQAKACEQV